MIELIDEIAAHLGTTETAFDRIFALTGQRFRFQEGRETLRVEIGGQFYVLKRHHGYGWQRLLRTFLSGHIPVVSARTEVEAIRFVSQAGVHSTDVVGWGEQGLNPATRRSFLLMRELTGCYDLNVLCRKWATNPPKSQFRRMVIKAIAATAKQMHESGINHRDFYLGHLWLDVASTENDPPRLHVIDLHRAMKHRGKVPLYWVVKDLSALLHSAWNCGLSKSDCMRFLSHYRDKPTREVLRKEKSFWKLVIWRARWFLLRTIRHNPPVATQRTRVLTPSTLNQPNVA